MRGSREGEVPPGLEEEGRLAETLHHKQYTVQTTTHLLKNGFFRERPLQGKVALVGVAT